MAQKVLVVDDDQNTVKYLTAVLREHGFESVSARDGVAGWEEIRRAQPDLVVLDVMMPKKSGFVLFKQIRRDTKYKDMPVLMMTGVSGVLDELEEQRQEPFEQPYNSLREALRKQVRQMREEGLIRPEMFMDKPLDADSFIEKVKELISP